LFYDVSSGNVAVDTSR